MNKSRYRLLELAQSGIESVHGGSLTGRAASQFRPNGPVHVAAVGKAAAAMASGAEEILGDDIQRALLITAKGYDDAPESQRFERLYGGHPVPSAESLIAGARLLRWVKETPRSAHLLFLISGGASSMVEVAAAGIEVADLQRANHWLLASGMSIGGINAVRRRMSRIKGGKLLAYLPPVSTEVWLLSDVAGDDPAVIGSGLLFPSPASALPDVEYPEWLRQLLFAETSDSDVLQRHAPVPPHRILGTLADACEAVARRARELQLPVRLNVTELEGDAEASGCRLGDYLLAAAPGMHIWGGETTVKLPEQSGVGGRNQHLALAAAVRIAGRDDVQLLALASDGRDGPGEDAGALVDGGTVARGTLHGFDAGECLRSADSGRFLEASGDLISTGPTGTNVRDLIIGWKT
ncbi:MAG: DUF4147 domain-containing protein [Thiogranum sp.]|nr:DUF4147 domain-containing protein [Thiogranum sp.]